MVERHLVKFHLRDQNLNGGVKSKEGESGKRTFSFLIQFFSVTRCWSRLIIYLFLKPGRGRRLAQVGTQTTGATWLTLRQLPGTMGGYS